MKGGKSRKEFIDTLSFLIIQKFLNTLYNFYHIFENSPVFEKHSSCILFYYIIESDKMDATFQNRNYGVNIVLTMMLFLKSSISKKENVLHDYPWTGYNIISQFNKECMFYLWLFKLSHTFSVYFTGVVGVEAGWVPKSIQHFFKKTQWCLQLITW